MSTPSVSSSAGVSSLLSKYQTLTSCIASTRSEIQSTETEILHLESSNISLQQIHQQMNHDLQTAYQESNDLNTSLSDTLRKKGYHKLSSTEMELQQQIRYLEGRLRTKKSLRAEQKREFQQSCRKFRLNIEQHRICFQGFEKDPLPFQDQDEELISARKNKSESDAILLKGKTLNFNAKAQQKTLQKEAIDRTFNLQQQIKQLKEIRRDVQEKERELQNLEQSTKEFEEINDGFARSAMNRKQQNMARTNSTPRAHHTMSSSITPSPSMSNSYGGHRPTVQNPYKKRVASNQLHSNSRSSLPEQYPHRAGRIRVDRQFSTGLSIGDIDVCDWDGSNINDYQIGDVPRGNKNEYGEEDYSSLESADKLLAAYGAKRVRQGDGFDKNGTMSSESSDDDDDVLTFTPFNSRE